jgi:hypothetical protein
MDFFCLTPNGIRVAYPSSGVLGKLAPKLRKQVRGRVILALTANRHYALKGVKPQTKLAKVRRRLRPGRGFRVGANTWYLVAARRSIGVLKVCHGQIQEIGIANRSLIASRAAARRLLTSLD